MTQVVFVGRSLNVGTVTTLLGTVAVSGGGGGVQYSVGDTSIAATGTGTIVIGIQQGATTARGLTLTTTGGIFNVQTIATVTTLLGTIAITGSGLFLGATTGVVGAFVTTAHSSRWQTFVTATTSAAGGVIVQTSGAHTLYITDLLISVASPMNVQLASETTAITSPIYLATNGGAVMDLETPFVCTSAQSLRVILSSSGNCGVSALGYTVT